MKKLLRTRFETGRFTVGLLIFLSSSLHVIAQDNIIFPQPAMDKIIDVTKPPFNADKTGVIDATAAIQMALDSAGFSSANIIYLPNGTYLVSNTLRWANRQTRDMLQGQSRNGTIIKLQDGATGYTNPAVTKAVIYTGYKPAQRFRNAIRNLTVNTGSGNAGATGVQFIANNQGGIYDVLIKSEDGQGVIGLDLGYTDEQGPCLMKRVQVIGFNTGIRTKFGVDGVVMEDIILEDQNTYAVHNDGQCFSIENLQTKGEVPAFLNTGTGVLTIIDSRFEGTGAASSKAAIINTNALFARNITTTGFLKAIDNSGSGGGKLIDSTNVTEFVSHEVLSLFRSPKRSLNLPIKQTPEVPWDALSNWVSVADYAPKDTTLTYADGSTKTLKDWTSAIQQAVDAGKGTVYFPPGSLYYFYGTVYVRGNVKRIIGMDIDARASGPHHGRWVIQNGTAPVVVLERFDSHYSEFEFTNNSNRQVVIKNLIAKKATNLSGSGDMFIEDVMFHVGTINIGAGTNVYGRQVNPENSQTGIYRIINEGGLFWVLGIKTEYDAGIVRTMSGGKTEILGGFIYANHNRDINKVMFLNEEGSQFSGTVGEFVYRNQPFNPVKETREGITKILKRGEVPGRAGGGMLPLYTGYRPIASAPPTGGGPSNLTGNAPRYNQIIINWTDNTSNEDGFVIERKIGSASFAPYELTDENITTLNDSLLTPSTTYAYRVRAVNSAGRTTYSNTVSITTPGAPPTPAVPTNMKVTVSPGYNLTIRWNDNSTFESGFKLERKTSADTAFVQIALLGPDVTEYVQRSQLANTTYAYRVRTYNEISHSEYSNIDSVTTPLGEEALIRWTMNETTGTLASDYSGHGLAGTLYNGVTFDANSVAGALDKALQLDGINDVVRRDVDFGLTAYPFTQSLWIKTTQEASTAMFWGDKNKFDYYYTLGVDTAGRARLTYRKFPIPENSVTGPIVNDGQWHLLTGVWRHADTLQLFVDGSLSATMSRNLPFYKYVNRVSVGALDHYQFKERFNGSIDDARFYSRALSPAEVVALYNEQTISEPVNLALTSTISNFSEQRSNQEAAKAIDGIDDVVANHWAAYTYPQYIELDLGSECEITGTTLVTNASLAYRFTVEAKKENESYQVIVDRSANTSPSPISDNVTGVRARFVKLTVTGGPSNAYNWVKIREFKVFGRRLGSSSARKGSSMEVSDVKAELTEGNDAQVSIFPNPSSDVINIQLFLEEDSPIEFNISSNGKTIFNKEQFSSKGYKTFTFNRQFSPGIYLVKIKTNRWHVVKKVFFE